MRTLVFSSMNLDKTYHLESFVKPGETVSASSFETFCGGKGFNIATALCRAGLDVSFAGAVGSDGFVLKDTLSKEGVDVSLIRESELCTGHAVIQVDGKGQNCIIIVPGANGDVDKSYIDSVLEHFREGDLIVLQNEISNIGYIIERAHKKGLVIAFNPSPYNERIGTCDLSVVDYLFVNEVEGEAITGKADVASMVEILKKRFAGKTVVLTLGEKGSVCIDGLGKLYECGIHKTKAIDTTAAGDTYMGYFLAGVLEDKSIGEAMKAASVASGIAVSRKGASASVPTSDEVRAVMDGRR